MSAPVVDTPVVATPTANTPDPAPLDPAPLNPGAPDLAPPVHDTPNQNMQVRSRDPQQTRRNILDMATAEFAAKGLSGARVDDIAARTRTTKRMIYYYFGSKDLLYAAVLEEMYDGIRETEKHLPLEGLPPEAAMRGLVELTFDYHATHPDFVRLVSVENIHDAQHIAQSPTIRDRNDAVLGLLRRLLARGVADGVFRDGIDPLDLHMLISGFCFHRVANRHTLGVIFGQDMQARDRVARQRHMLVESVLRYLQP